jgi:hypothetical protein
MDDNTLRAPDTDVPMLSIVIAIIAGGRDPLESCLEALEADAVAYRVECIVPYDGRLDGLTQLARRFPWVEFVDAQSEIDVTQYGNASREHHDILRAIGLRRARGRIVAMLEDHAPPSPGWCRAVFEAHKQPFAAVGGAVENGVNRLLNWAVYYCDFGRYQNPLPEGPTEFLSDSNASYKREALASVKDLWFDSFRETFVNWELARRGEALRFDPRMVVHQTRKSLRLLPALRERYVWGRSFAGTRASETTMIRRVISAALSFLLPAVLTLRVVSRALRKRRNLDRLVLSAPLIVLLETIWSLGEFVGYVTGRSDTLRRETDELQRET